MWKIEQHLILLYAVFYTGSTNYDPDMDRTLFEIKWPGMSDVNKLDTVADDQNVVVMTKENEKYKCILPEKIITSSDDPSDNYNGPNEFKLLETLMDQTSCSYRIEAYWTYELCHGKHLRQYHEEKEMGKKPKLQEYYLGKFDRYAAKAELESNAAEDEKDKEDSRKPMKRVEGVEVPYYEMLYTGGTVCDLNNQPRKAHIHYTCHLEGKGEIYEIKETASCEYEVVILTSLLCTHPGYAPPKEPVNYIQCQPVEESPPKPKSLVDFELENNKGKYNKRQFWGDSEGNTLEDILESVLNGFEGKIKINIDGAEYEGEFNDDEEEEGNYERVHKKTGTTFFQKQNLDQVQEHNAAQKQEQKQPAQSPVRSPDTIGAGTDQSLLKEFLAGDFCIRGGTGWWRHEFCYGKKVIQYHEIRRGRKHIRKEEIVLGEWNQPRHLKWIHDNPYKAPFPAQRRTNGKTVVLLGTWDEAAHIQWLESNPTKKPKPAASRKSISQYYGNGEICDLTGKPRFTEVKLKCRENPAQPHAVAIYLVEPNTCEYIVVVESPIFCDLIKKADKYGLIPPQDL